MKHIKTILTQINTTVIANYCSFMYILGFSNNLSSFFSYPTPATKNTRCPLSKCPLVDFYWPSKSYLR